MSQLEDHYTDEKGILDLSVIVVSWNAKEFLRQCLKSVYETTRQSKFEIWVVDNDSSDGSPEMVIKEFPHLNLVCNDDNIGFAKANNIGIRRSNARYIILFKLSQYVPLTA